MCNDERGACLGVTPLRHYDDTPVDTRCIGANEFLRDTQKCIWAPRVNGLDSSASL